MQLSDVERRRMKAYWYAVGWSDGTGQEDISSEFSEYAANDARDFYERHTRSHLASIADQWLQFIATRSDLTK